MKIYAKDNMDLGLGRKYNKGDEINAPKTKMKEVTPKELQGLYDKGMLESERHDEKRKAFDLEMEISKVEGEMKTVEKEIENKKLELKSLKEKLKK